MIDQDPPDTYEPADIPYALVQIARLGEVLKAEFDPGPAEDGVHALGLEPPFPPADGAAEQNRTAVTVAHGCPASSSSRMWARNRTSWSAARR